MEIELNKWEQHLTHWCPAQMYYYFLDSAGGKWCIYLRWDGQRGDEPWQAELFQCDDDWEFKWDCERVDLLEEKEHTPGIVTGFYPVPDGKGPGADQRMFPGTRFSK